MTESQSSAATPQPWRPHEFDHRHGDVSNTALIAGVGAVADAHTVVISGCAGLVAGAFSMALGEFASVTTANEQIESEVRVEQRAFRLHPQAEKAELVDMLVTMGLTEETAAKASDEIHRDEDRALNFHLSQELGVDPDEKPSPYVAAGSSFAMFATGAIVPLIPYLLGFRSLWLGLLFGGVGLLIAGAVAARFTRKPLWWASLRQLLFGTVAIAATYAVGTLIGTVV